MVGAAGCWYSPLAAWKHARSASVVSHHLNRVQAKQADFHQMMCNRFGQELGIAIAKPLLAREIFLLTGSIHPAYSVENVKRLLNTIAQFICITLVPHRSQKLN
jgi:hypothetical protein